MAFPIDGTSRQGGANSNDNNKTYCALFCYIIPWSVPISILQKCWF